MFSFGAARVLRGTASSHGAPGFLMASSRVASVLVKRGIFLFVALVLIVVLAAVIIGATGYDTKVLQAIIEGQVRAYKQSLQQKGLSAERVNMLVENYTKTLEHIYGLDRPWYYRVLPLAFRTLTLDLGNVTQDQVAEVVGEQLPLRVSTAILKVLPRTIIMITIAELVCGIIVLFVGPLIAYRRGSLVDKAAITYAAVMNALPVWWLGLIAVFFFGYYLHIAPTRYRDVVYYINNFWSSPLHNLVEIAKYAWLPMVIVIISFLGSWLYGVRAIALRVVGEDYVAVARAKGLPENLVIRRYVLRVVAGPALTIVILGLAGSLGGFIITESVFGWPGMGSLYYAAISSGDSATILGLIYVTTLVYIVARFILEVLYVWLDPRVKF